MLACVCVCVVEGQGSDRGFGSFSRRVSLSLTGAEGPPTAGSKVASKVSRCVPPRKKGKINRRQLRPRNNRNEGGKKEEEEGREGGGKKKLEKISN